MQAHERFDLIIIGGGVGGVISLYYAKQAGLKVLLLEKQSAAGGLWRQLPAWQDIQISPLDWTLGDVPIAGPQQASIADNIPLASRSIVSHIRGNARLDDVPVDGKINPFELIKFLALRDPENHPADTWFASWR